MTSLTKKLTVALLALIAAVCLAFGLLFTVNTASAAGSDNVITLSGDGEYKDYLNIVGGEFQGFKTPADGKPINELLNGKKFALVLPETVTSVAAGTNKTIIVSSVANLMVSLTLPNSLESIGNYAFADCKGLEGIVLDRANSKLKTIGNSAFSGCTMLDTITIPTGVTSIGNDAFSGCSSVKTVNYHATYAIPMTKSPFSGIGNATVNIEGVGDTMKNLPHSLFRGTNVVAVNYKNIRLSGNSLFGDEIFADCTNLKRVTFGDNCYTSTIGDKSFSGCTALTTINVPSDVTKIGVHAFYDCRSLLGITIPAGVTVIGDDAFFNCTSLLEVINKSGLDLSSKITTANVHFATSDADSEFMTEGDFLFFDNGDLRLVSYLGADSDIELPDDVGDYRIYKEAFKNNYYIKTVTMPDTVVGIGTNAFMGCTSLTTVNIPKSVRSDDTGTKKLGDAIFADCSALTDVNFQSDDVNGINNIATQMFLNCTSLKRIEIPQHVSRIGRSAFEGCSKLERVDFTPFEHNGKSYYRTQYYEGSAFKGCISLTTITIHEAYSLASASDPNGPHTAGYVSFGASVFEGCVKLETLFIPKGVNFSGLDDFKGCVKLMVIAPDSTAYTEYTSDSKYNNVFSGVTLTYPIEITLKNVKKGDFGTAPADKTVYKYYGVGEQALPVQDGYKTSVWYEQNEAGELTGAFTQETFNQKLQEREDSFVIYAYYLGLPDIPEKNFEPLTYTNGSNLLSNVILQKWFNAELGNSIGVGSNFAYTAKVLKYTDMAGLNYVGASLIDAGYYTLSIVINDVSKYGEWLRGHEFEIAVAPQTIDPLDAIQWGVVNGNSVEELLPTEAGSGDNNKVLYNYDNRWFETKQYVAGTEELPHEENYSVTVSRSYVLWTGSDFTVKLLYDGLSLYFDVLSYSGDITRSDGGRYEATATVKMTNNYALNPNDNSLLERYGITISYLQVGNTYRITKVWYVVSSNANRLLLNGSTYRVDGWQYMSNGASDPKAPTLFKGDDAQLKFSLELYRNEDPSQGSIGQWDFDYEDFSFYMNTGMPAGYYILSVHIPELTIDTVKYEGGTHVYPFSVSNAPNSVLEDLLGTSTVNAIYNKTIYADYDEDAKANFGINETNLPVLGLTASEIHDSSIRKGVWDNPDFDEFYSSFVIMFSYNNSAYMTAEEFTSGPKNIGEYNNISYRVSAPGYADLTGVYHLRIRGAVDAPANADVQALNIVYTGDSLVNKINFNSEYYDVVYLTDDWSSVRVDGINRVNTLNLRERLITLGHLPEGTKASTYTEAGEYYVVLFIRYSHRETAKWSDATQATAGYVDDLVGYYGECVVLKINIEKATNSTVGTPSVEAWEYGSFSKSVNRPVWLTRYHTEQQFKLISYDNNNIVYWYNPSETQDGFGKAPAGKYWLQLVASASDNVRAYEAIRNDWVLVEIKKANLYWDIAPKIDAWKYGSDPATLVQNGTLPDAHLGIEKDLTYYICKASDYGKEDATRYSSYEELKNANGGHVPAGNWVFVYELAASANYEAWSYPIYFTVLGESFWDIAPVIPDFAYGGYYSELLETLSYKTNSGKTSGAQFAFRLFSLDGNPIGGWVYNRSGLETLLDGNGQLSVGKYEYNVTIDGGEFTYNSYFYVTQAANGWESVPTILGWEEGAFDAIKNLPAAKAEFGTVYYYTVKTASGEDIEGLTHILASQLEDADILGLFNNLGAGNYKLVVEVRGNDDYKNISAEIDFTVFENSLGSIGLIATTLVFAIIVTGLGAAVLVLLILKNKNKRTRSNGADSKKR